jgi:hypothetical protein
MKIRHIPVISILALSLSVAYPAAVQGFDAPAAATTAAQTVPSAAKNLDQVRAMLTALQGNVSSTMASLDVLKQAARERTALEKPYADFAAQYQLLESRMEAVRQQGSAARASSDAFFQNWQNTIAGIVDKDLKESATERFDKAKSRYVKALATVDASRQKVPPYVADLKDINTLLKVDLTTDSIKSLYNTFGRLDRNAESLLDAIAGVNKEIGIVLESLPKQ